MAQEYSYNLKKNIALATVVVFAALIFYMFYEFVAALIFSVIIGVLVMPIYKYLYNKTNSANLSAGLVLVGIFLLILIPLSSIVGIMLTQITQIELTDENIRDYERTISTLIGIEVSLEDLVGNIERNVQDLAQQYLPKVVTFTTNFLLSLFIMFFILFYMMVDNKRFFREFLHFMPFSKEKSMLIVDKSIHSIKAIIYGQLLTAVVQGLLGMISFFIVGIGVAESIFWGIIMIILSIIPIVGAFLVWLPAGVFLLMEEQIWQGIFVLAWGALVVSQIDNIIRPKLVERFSQEIHPLETFIGVIVGIASFGIIGVILGPLIIALFKILVSAFKEEYLVDKNKNST